MAKMIDVSIQSAEKYLTSDKKLKEFLESPVKIYEKLDGIKINLYHIDNTGIPEKDWVVGYKGNIIYSSEFEYLSDIQIKNSSISGSQFKFIFDYLKKVDSKSIPVNYEFFTEYLMRKPSLLSNYKYNHRLVLLACSPSKIDIAMGKVRSKGNFDISRRDEFAKLLKVDTPPIVFDGILRLFESGCKSKELLSIYNANKHLLTGELSDVSVFTDILLKLDSKYGNTPEGFVLDFGDKILKVQQSYQLDKDIRADKRNDFKMSDEEEKRYQDYVRLSSLNIINKLKRPFREVDLPNILKEVANELKILKDIPEHKKKNKTQILDDIQSNCKRIVIKQLTGNKFFLFLGKFRILTKAHYNTIKEGLKTHNGGVVCLITGSKTKFSRDLRYKMLQTCFPDIRIVEHSSANIFRILQDIPVNISSVLCGTDRVNAYASMLSKAPDIKIQEFKRTDRDISATAVLENLENELYFKANTPKEIHSMYKEILKVYETPESRLHESFDIEYKEYDYVTRLVEETKDTNLDLRDRIKLGIKERLDEINNFEEEYKLWKDYFNDLKKINEANDTTGYKLVFDDISKMSDKDKNSLKNYEIAEKFNGKFKKHGLAFKISKDVLFVKVSRVGWSDFCSAMNINPIKNTKFNIGFDNSFKISPPDKNKITTMSVERGNGSVKHKDGMKDFDSTTLHEMGVAIMYLFSDVINIKKIPRTNEEELDNFNNILYSNIDKLNYKIISHSDFKSVDSLKKLAEAIIIENANDISWLESNFFAGLKLRTAASKLLPSATISSENSSFGDSVKKAFKKASEKTSYKNLGWDKWNPADIFVHKDGVEDKLRNVNSISELNNIFLDSKNVLSISLKKSHEEAFHGSVSTNEFDSEVMKADIQKKYNINISDMGFYKLEDNEIGEETYNLIIDKIKEKGLNYKFDKIQLYKLKKFYECLGNIYEKCKNTNILNFKNKQLPKTFEDYVLGLKKDMSETTWEYFYRVLKNVEAIVETKNLNKTLEAIFRISGSFIENFSAPYVKIEGDRISTYNYRETPMKVEVTTILLGVNGDGDCVFNLNVNDEKMYIQLRSKGNKPQFIIGPGNKYDS